MRRWNGWGDEAVNYPISASVLSFLEHLLGAGRRPKDSSQKDVLTHIPKSRLPKHPLVSTDPVSRLLHARGQSFPNWVDMRSGHISTFPDGVAYPMSGAEVSELIQYGRKTDISLIPYGGGTSVGGHIDPIKSKTAVLTVDMRRMNHLVEIDVRSLLATFEAGISGPDLEARLHAQGCTLGHYPQSFEYSTLGGWISTAIEWPAIPALRPD